MKRMYVVLAIMFTIVFYAGSLLGQQKSRPIDDHEGDSVSKIMKMREEMHKRMMDKLLHDLGPDQDMFSDMDQMMDEMMKDSFQSFQYFQSEKSNYTAEWKESSQGRTLEITPKSKDQKLDINVANGMITIKGKSEQKSNQGSFVSNFSNSFSIPQDCDAGKVKMDQKDGKILVSFPFLAAKAVQKAPQKRPDRVPLGPAEGDVEI